MDIIQFLLFLYHKVINIIIQRFSSCSLNVNQTCFVCPHTMLQILHTFVCLDLLVSFMRFHSNGHSFRISGKRLLSISWKRLERYTNYNRFGVYAAKTEPNQIEGGDGKLFQKPRNSSACRDVLPYNLELVRNYFHWAEWNFESYEEEFRVYAPFEWNIFTNGAMRSWIIYTHYWH